MEAVDKKLQEILSKKFEGAEMDVDPSIWEGINNGLSAGSGEVAQGGSATTGLTGSTSFWVAAWVAAITAVSVALWPSTDEPGEQPTTSVTQVVKEKEDAVQLEQNTILENDSPEQQSEEVIPVSADDSEKVVEVVSVLETESADKQQESSNEFIDQKLPEDVPVEIENDEPDSVEGDQEDSIGPEDKDNDVVVEEGESTSNTGLEQAEETPEKIDIIVRPLANVFSPNGDGMNDRYLPELVEATKVSIQVIQMTTGQLVFQSNEAVAWNGLGTDGQVLPEGPYLYIIEVSNAEGGIDQESEIVRLFR